MMNGQPNRNLERDMTIDIEQQQELCSGSVCRVRVCLQPQSTHPPLLSLCSRSARLLASCARQSLMLIGLLACVLLLYAGVVILLQPCRRLLFCLSPHGLRLRILRLRIRSLCRTSIMFDGMRKSGCDGTAWRNCPAYCWLAAMNAGRRNQNWPATLLALYIKPQMYGFSTQVSRFSSLVGPG